MGNYVSLLMQLLIYLVVILPVVKWYFKTLKKHRGQGVIHADEYLLGLRTRLSEQGHSQVHSYDDGKDWSHRERSKILFPPYVGIRSSFMRRPLALGDDMSFFTQSEEECAPTSIWHCVIDQHVYDLNYERKDNK